MGARESALQRRVQVADPQLSYSGMGLTEYKRKRDFKKTAEPAGGKPLPRKDQRCVAFCYSKTRSAPFAL